MSKEKKGSVRSFYVDDAIYTEFVKVCNENGIQSLSPVITLLMQYFISKQKEIKDEQ